MDRASCAGMDPAVFHELAWNPVTQARSKGYDDAVRVCSTCPVRARCLSYALGLKVPIEGVIAGYNPLQIKRMKRSAL